MASFLKVSSSLSLNHMVLTSSKDRSNSRTWILGSKWVLLGVGSDTCRTVSVTGGGSKTGLAFCGCSSSSSKAATGTSGVDMLEDASEGMSESMDDIFLVTVSSSIATTGFDLYRLCRRIEDLLRVGVVTGDTVLDSIGGIGGRSDTAGPDVFGVSSDVVSLTSGPGEGASFVATRDRIHWYAEKESIARSSFWLWHCSHASFFHSTEVGGSLVGDECKAGKMTRRLRTGDCALISEPL